MARPRSTTEIKLLRIRQRLLDVLIELERQPIVPLEVYRQAKAQLLTTEALLSLYRAKYSPGRRALA